MPRMFLTHFLGPDGPKESDYYYQADAEVEVVLDPAIRADCFGKTLTFRFGRMDLVWSGHLDDDEPRPYKVRRPIDSGNARLCLHNLFIQTEKFPPLGYPFQVGDTFDVFAGDAKLGHCTIKRAIDYMEQKIYLDRPTA